MTNPPPSNTCPQCRAALPADAPQGLCPACLLAAVAEPTEAGTAPLPKAPPPTREQVAAAFPHLEILELIGAGGMGYVFKARQPKLDRLVALKLLPQHLGADAAFAGRFEREGRVLARLSHPNIVTVHDFGFARAGDLQSPSLPITTSPDGDCKSPAPPLSTFNSQPSTAASGFYYLLMEFVDGVNLRQAMRAGRFTPVQALDVVPKICEALQFAHEQGILHRDIKPENILLDAKGRVKLVDFGIAKLVGPAEAILPADSKRPQMGNQEAAGAEICGRLESAGKPSPSESALTSATVALGTPSYMAPEQRDRPAEVDHRADIYSLGVVFYEMLTGELPVGKFAPPSAKSASDPRVDQVVLRALEQQRERRQQSAGEVKTQVENITATPGSNRREETPPRAGSQRMPGGVASPKLAWVVVPVLLGAGWLLLFSGGGETTDNSAFNRYFPLVAFFGVLILIIGGSGWLALKHAKPGSSPLVLPVWLLPGVTFLLAALEFHNSSRGYGLFWLSMALASLWSRERLGDSLGAKCLVGAGYAIGFGGLGLMLGKSYLPEAWQTWLRPPADTSLAAVLTTLAVLGTVAIVGWLTPLLFGLSPRDAGKREQFPTSFLKYPGLLLLLLPGLLFVILLMQFYPQLENSDGNEQRALPQAGPTTPAAIPPHIEFKVLRVENPPGTWDILLHFERDQNPALGLEVWQDMTPSPGLREQPHRGTYRTSQVKTWAGVNDRVLGWTLPFAFTEAEVRAVAKDMEQRAKSWRRLPDGALWEFATVTHGDGWKYHLLANVKRAPGAVPPAADAKSASTNALAKAAPPKPVPDRSPKQITFQQITNLNGHPYLTSQTLLAPGESFQGWLVLPDGSRERALSSENVFNNSGQERGSCTWSWILPSPFSTNHADEVVSQLRERWAGNLLACPPGQPVTMFTLTNESGVKISGEVQFNRTFVDPDKPAVAEVKLRNHLSHLSSLMFFTSQVPDGYALHIRIAGTEIHAAHSTLSRSSSSHGGDSHCSWHWMDGDYRGEFSPVAMKQAQMLFDQGPLLITNGQPRTLFSVTNANGKIYSGQFELRGPASTK